MIKKIICLSIFFTIISCTSTIVMGQYLSLNPTELKKLTVLIQTDSSAQKAFSLLEKHAKIAIKQEPLPIDTIISEGHLVTDPKKIKTIKSLGDLNKIYALAYTYKITNSKDYLEKCLQYIIAWAKVNQAIANPINNTKLDPLFEAYDLIKEEVNVTDKEVIEKWFRQIAFVEITDRRQAIRKKSAYNNWNSHKIKIVANIAYLLNDKQYMVFVDTSLRKQIAMNLYADGSGADFIERDALHYHYYTLEPLLVTATIIKRATGFNYYNYISASGSSIQKSVEFLIPYATGEKTHAEFVNSNVAFDRKRAQNKEPDYMIGANFNPKKAIDVFISAAYFNPAYLSIVKKLAEKPSKYANWQCVLNAVKN
jgi:ribosomal protein L10